MATVCTVLVFFWLSFDAAFLLCGVPVCVSCILFCWFCLFWFDDKKVGWLFGHRNHMSAVGGHVKGWLCRSAAGQNHPWDGRVESVRESLHKNRFPCFKQCVDRVCLWTSFGQRETRRCWKKIVSHLHEHTSSVWELSDDFQDCWVFSWEFYNHWNLLLAGSSRQHLTVVCLHKNYVTHFKVRDQAHTQFNPSLWLNMYHAFIQLTQQIMVESSTLTRTNYQKMLSLAWMFQTKASY